MESKRCQSLLTHSLCRFVTFYSFLKPLKMHFLLFVGGPATSLLKDCAVLRKCCPFSFLRLHIYFFSSAMQPNQTIRLKRCQDLANSWSIGQYSRQQHYIIIKFHSWGAERATARSQSYSQSKSSQSFLLIPLNIKLSLAHV